MAEGLVAVGSALEEAGEEVLEHLELGEISGGVIEAVICFKSLLVSPFLSLFQVSLDNRRVHHGLGLVVLKVR